MGLEELLGNERLRENLSRSIQRGHLSHFYLISGPEGSGKHTLARLLSAAALCQGQQKPCRTCRDCRKIFDNSHPDVRYVIDPEHKYIPVDMVRTIREDAFIKPNEGAKKVYIFPQELRIEGQNTLLKILEEPPAYGVFILLTDNPEKLLPTIRSRCTELRLTALPETLLLSQLQSRFPQESSENIQAAALRSGGYLGQAITILEEGNARCPHTEHFAKSYANRDAMGLVTTLVPMEKWKRDQLLPVLTRWQETLQMALLCRCGQKATSELSRTIAGSRSAEELVAAIGHIQKAITYTQGNISVAAVCGWLEWVLR